MFLVEKEGDCSPIYKSSIRLLFTEASLSFKQGGLTFVRYDITNFTLGRKCGMTTMVRAGNSMNAEEKEES